MVCRCTTVRRVLLEIGWFFAVAPQSRLHQLAQLRELDDRLLSDIGVTRREAIAGHRRAKGRDFDGRANFEE